MKIHEKLTPQNWLKNDDEHVGRGCLTTQLDWVGATDQEYETVLEAVRLLFPERLPKWEKVAWEEPNAAIRALQIFNDDRKTKCADVVRVLKIADL